MSTRSCIHSALTTQQVRAEPSRPLSAGSIGKESQLALPRLHTRKSAVGGCQRVHAPLHSTHSPDLYAGCAEEKYKGAKEIAHTRPHRTSTVYNGVGMAGVAGIAGEMLVILYTQQNTSSALSRSRRPQVRRRV